MLFVLVLIIIFFFFYIIFCVPSNEYNFLGRIKLRLKSGFEQFMTFLPAPIKNRIMSTYNYFVYKPNPSVQIFYVILFLTLFLLYYYNGIKIYFPNKIIKIF